MDIDSLFKKPSIPAGKNKRKLKEHPTAQELEEFTREAQSNGRDGLQRPKKKVAVSLEDGHEDLNRHHEGDSLPEHAEDSDDRFYGGGLTSRQSEILDLMEGPSSQRLGAPDETVHDDDFEDVIDLTAIRRQLLSFEKAINHNQDQRSKYPDQPEKFIESEADLDAALRGLLALTTHPNTFYPEMCRLGAVDSVVGLLSHENEDIAVATLEVLNELTDEEVGADESQQEEDVVKSGVAPGLEALAEALVKLQALDLIVQVMSRFAETDQVGQNGVYYSLGLIENMVSIRPNLAAEILRSTKLMQWTLQRLQSGDQAQNRYYAAEVLAILFQSTDSAESHKILESFARLDGIEVFLQIIAEYRSRDPQSPEEVEFLENIFDVLCTVVGPSENRQLLLEAEGVELLIILLKERKLAQLRAIKLLDHLVAGPNGVPIAEQFVQSNGLKQLFAAFMGKGTEEYIKKYKLSRSEIDDHFFNIFASFFTVLDSESESRIRFQAKFVERSYEKMERLLECRELTETRLQNVERSIESTRTMYREDGTAMGEAEEYEFYLRRLEGGQFSLQVVDYVLAWIATEDDGAKERMGQLLKRKGKSFRNLRIVLTAYRNDFGDAKEEKSSNSIDLRTIIDHLIDSLPDAD